MIRPWFPFQSNVHVIHTGILEPLETLCVQMLRTKAWTMYRIVVDWDPDRGLPDPARCHPRELTLPSHKTKTVRITIGTHVILMYAAAYHMDVLGLDQAIEHISASELIDPRVLGEDIEHCDKFWRRVYWFNIVADGDVALVQARHDGRCWIVAIVSVFIDHAVSNPRLDTNRAEKSITCDAVAGL